MPLVGGTFRFDPATGAASGEVTVDARRAETGNAKRDKTMHADVLESERFPSIVFKVERVEGALAESGRSDLRLAGVMILHGSDHRMTLRRRWRMPAGACGARCSFRSPTSSGDARPQLPDRAGGEDGRCDGSRGRTLGRNPTGGGPLMRPATTFAAATVVPARRRSVALAYGFTAHGLFLIGVGAMVLDLHQGMRLSLGPARGPRQESRTRSDPAVPDRPLVPAQRQGPRDPKRLAPERLGADLATTTFAAWPLSRSP